MPLMVSINKTDFLKSSIFSVNLVDMNFNLYAYPKEEDTLSDRVFYSILPIRLLISHASFIQGYSISN